MLPPSGTKCSPSLIHKPTKVEVGEGGAGDKAELSFPQNASTIIFQSWEHHYHLGLIAWLPMQPQRTITKALIILIRAIASCWPSHYLGVLSQPWSQYPLWLTPSQTSHFPTVYNPDPNYASVCPWPISSPRPLSLWQQMSTTII